MIVALFFVCALSGLIYIIRFIHRALPYAIAFAPLGLYRKNPIAFQKNICCIYHYRAL